MPKNKPPSVPVPDEAPDQAQHTSLEDDARELLRQMTHGEVVGRSQAAALALALRILEESAQQ